MGSPQRNLMIATDRLAACRIGLARLAEYARLWRPKIDRWLFARQVEAVVASGLEVQGDRPAPPIVLMTGARGVPDLAIPPEAREFPVLEKPFAGEALLGALGQILETQEPEG